MYIYIIIYIYICVYIYIYCEYDIADITDWRVLEAFAILMRYEHWVYESLEILCAPVTTSPGHHGGHVADTNRRVQLFRLSLRLADLWRSYCTFHIYIYMIYP